MVTQKEKKIRFQISVIRLYVVRVIGNIICWFGRSCGGGSMGHWKYDLYGEIFFDLANAYFWHWAQCMCDCSSVEASPILVVI
jgi:hypothetical protein